VGKGAYLASVRWPCILGVVGPPPASARAFRGTAAEGLRLPARNNLTSLPNIAWLPPTE